MTACIGGEEPINESSTSASAAVEPVLVEGNPTCADLGFRYEAKIDSPNAGSVNVPLLGGNTVTITVSGNQKTLTSWSSTVPLDAVLMKGGDAANAYYYNPERSSDTNLVSPDNSSGGPAQISHINFCYDLELSVKKTAVTSFKRDWGWSITKSAAANDLLLSLNQVYSMMYTVVVATTGKVDSDWNVSGTVTVKNPDPYLTAQVASVTDDLSGFGTITLDCGSATFPLSLAPNASLVCTYSQALPNGDARTNTATATTVAGSQIDGNTGTAAVSFADADAAITTVDGCVDVTDTLAGTLGTVCAADVSKTFTYWINIAFATCGPHETPNTATFTSTNGETGSASVTVGSEVPCVDGCTLTQGYWKTHSINGPAPYDDAWAGKETSPFFTSSLTYYQMLWRAPKGNAYVILAHQYIAAEMNKLNGANFTAAQSAFDQATTLFQTYNMTGFSKSVAQQMLALASTLDQYNNGLIGPGHCSE